MGSYSILKIRINLNMTDVDLTLMIVNVLDLLLVIYYSTSVNFYVVLG